MEADTLVLERIDDGISDALRDEIRTLVDAKYLVDKLARSAAGRRLTVDFHDGAYGPRHGTELFRTVLPFSDLVFKGKTFDALVPTAQTIGASWRWTTPSVPEEERETLLANLLDPASMNVGRERAEIIWIEPLGLFLAHEGKNRVGFFRDMRADWFPARVSSYDYPAQDRLIVYEVERADRTSYWAVLDGRVLESINHPEWALPVLRAYGVQVSREWPSHFPSIDTTATAIAEHGINQSTAASTEALNLPLVLAKEVFQTEEITCSLIDIEPVKVSRKYTALMVGISFAAFVLLAVLPLQWDNVRVLTAMVFAGPVGAMIAFVLPLLRLPRRMAEPFAVYREFGEIRGRTARVKFKTR
jgi:hypothetical protein